MAGVLALVETKEGSLRSSGIEAMSAATVLAERMGTGADALVVGPPEIDAAAGALSGYGAGTIHLALDPALAGYRPEVFAEIAVQVIREGEYDVVLLAGTGLGRDLAGRLGALLDVPVAEDATAISVMDGRLRIERPVFAGKALATVEVDVSPTLVTLRPGAFPVQQSEGAGTLARRSLALDPGRWPTETISRESGSAEVPDVSEASIVVSGGRGLRDPESWRLLEELCAELGPEAGLGASRAVVDAGWRPHSEQVGQTGKTVAPRLYFAIGISGAVQHLAGMRTAGTIVAINRDRDAPIFRVADYGIVGDAFEVVPRLTEELRSPQGR
ncbi:MAG: electron transfer flavoprotein subunit alpha/FixB family protein [Gemmatimonadota bacterium]